jgi:hypothetical protein
VPGIESRDFDAPDEVRRPHKTTVELVELAGGVVGRYTFEPGWRWSECIRPLAGTESCEVEHVGYVVSGTLHVEHEDGTAGDVGPGSVYRIAPGHVGWVVGDEPAVFIEFRGAESYAKAPR